MLQLSGESTLLRVGLYGGIMNYKVRLIIFIFLVVMLTSCSRITDMDIQYSKVTDNQLGYGIQILNTNNEIIKEFKHEVSENFDFKVRFYNRSGHPNQFKLIMLLNYLEIDYTSTDKLFNNNEYFFLENDADIVIPLSIPVTYKNHSFAPLIVSVVAGPQKHAGDLGDTSDFYGVSQRIDLTQQDNMLKPFESKSIKYSSNTRVLISKDPSNVYEGILINQDNYSENEFFRLPPNELKTKPNENVKLNVRVNGLAKDYLAFFLLNWKQIEVNENENWWYFRNPEGDTAYKEITIKAPEQPGKYEISAYLVSNPWLIRDDDNNVSFTIDTSFRFTLHVE